MSINDSIATMDDDSDLVKELGLGSRKQYDESSGENRVGRQAPSMFLIIDRKQGVRNGKVDDPFAPYDASPYYLR